MINRDLFVAPMRNCSHVDHNDYDFYLYTSRRANGVAPEWSYKNQSRGKINLVRSRVIRVRVQTD